MAAYLGPTALLSTLISDPPHSITRQAWAPTHLREGAVNVDGTGVVWWPDNGAEPVRYATQLPPWADPNLAELARGVQGRVQLAAVRAATVGMPFGQDAAAPFTFGRVAVSHNGAVKPFRGPIARTLLDRLPDDVWDGVGTVTDSVAIVMTIEDELRERPADGLVGALTSAVEQVEKACRGNGGFATLALVASDGDRLVGVRTAVDRPAPSLFALHGSDERPGVAMIASEPLDDDPAWTEIPTGHLVEATAEHIDRRPLG